MCAQSALYAQPYVLSSPQKRQEPSLSHQRYAPSSQKTQGKTTEEASRKKSLVDHRHSISLGSLYSDNRLSQFKWTVGAEQKYPSLDQYKNRSWGLMGSYHYRPSRFFSIGFLLQRTQIPLQTLALYNDPPPHDAVTPRYTVTVDSVVRQATGFFSKESTAYVVLRQHFLPESAWDPFFELGIGLSHQKGVLEYSDTSQPNSAKAQYVRVADHPFVFSLGAGLSKSLNDHVALTAAFLYRNQKMAKFEGIDSLTGVADNLRSYDLRLGMTYGW